MKVFIMQSIPEMGCFDPSNHLAFLTNKNMKRDAPRSYLVLSTVLSPRYYRGASLLIVPSSANSSQTSQEYEEMQLGST